MYVGAKSALGKSLGELSDLRKAGLSKAYLGVETGDDRLLSEVNKGVSYSEMLEAGRRLVMTDINLSVMVLLGLAGRGYRSKEHALATAQIINEMCPQYLAVLTVTPVPGTQLYRQVQSDQFQMLNSFETLEEMKWIIENITINNLKFVGTHASNYLPMTGTLSKDQDTMIIRINEILANRDQTKLRPETMRGL